MFWGITTQHQRSVGPPRALFGVANGIAQRKHSNESINHSTEINWRPADIFSPSLRPARVSNIYGSSTDGMEGGAELPFASFAALSIPSSIMKLPVAYCSLLVGYAGTVGPTDSIHQRLCNNHNNSVAIISIRASSSETESFYSTT